MLSNAQNEFFATLNRFTINKNETPLRADFCSGLQHCTFLELNISSSSVAKDLFTTDLIKNFSNVFNGYYRSRRLKFYDVSKWKVKLTVTKIAD